MTIILDNKICADVSCHTLLKVNEYRYCTKCAERLNKMNFLSDIKQLAKEYGSKIPNKKDRSSTKSESFNNISESRRLQSIGSLTDAEYKRMYEEVVD